MSEKDLNLLGLMRRANAISIGETNSGAAVRGGKGKILLLAKDASDNAARRADGFVYGRNIPLVRLPYTKEEISAHVGLNGCSMAVITDIGFANALMKSLAAQWPETYQEAAQEMAQRLKKAEKRKNETAAHERNKRTGKRRNV